MRARPVHALIACAALSAGCNRYATFVVAGSQQQSFTNDADILFVIDNSASMTDEAAALAENIQVFIKQFASTEPPKDPTLTDDVDRYLGYVLDRAANIDYRIGITTTEVGEDRGLLQGDPAVLTRNTTNVPRKFSRNLLCDAACITDGPSTGVTCDGGAPPGPGNCANNQTGAAEEGIEAVFMAMCHALGDELSDEAREACEQPFWLWPDIGRYRSSPPPDDPNAQPVDYFDAANTRNQGWLRPTDPETGASSVVVPIIISDEGDQSRRLAERTPLVDDYLALFDLFGRRMSWALIGPDSTCSDLAVDWGINRYRGIVESTSGVYVPIASEIDGTCQNAPFAQALTDVGLLLRGLADTFPLASVPLPDTIVVEVNGRFVPPATQREDELLQRIVYEDGWYYDDARNSVRLKGDAVPPLNADVRIWYLPDTSNPVDVQ
ncbi:MAG: hypothetical protein H6732_16050 [Alphaproteobacteria bacterium]|nr:hypothetical protein [Alphaproteobacteria bacterium]